MVKTAELFSVPTADMFGFAWRWRVANGSRQSESTFTYFYDCVQDARRAGYAVELGVASAKGLDGSSLGGLT